MSARSRLPLLAVSALVLGACGSDDDQPASAASGNGVDRAFVSEMVPHHKSAVEMAEIATERAQRQKIKRLAEDIVTAQNAEIQTLNAIASKLEGEGVQEGDLGVPASEMGMSHDSSMLETARPFDRQFIDMMIPHHQGAIRMARVEIEKGRNPEAKRLAHAIVDAQAREIDEMNMWRVDWYGKLSPAGGVPAEDARPEEGHHG